jgi:hypothetical protein
MTQTVEASFIRVGDELRNDFQGEFSQVIERVSFRRGARIFVRLANGAEIVFSACTSVIVNRN